MRIAEIAPHGVGPGALQGTVFGALALYLNDVLPFLTASVAILGGFAGFIYYCIGIWESETLKSWRSDRSARKRLRRMGRLKLEQRVVLAELKRLEKQLGADDPVIQETKKVAATSLLERGD